MNNLDDKELISLLKKGTHDAFNKIFIRYYSKVYFFILGFIKDEDDAKDLAQDIFAKLWDNRKNLEIQNLKSFLFTASKNHVLNFLQHKSIEEGYANNFLTVNYDEGKNNSEEEYIAKELSDIINLTIENMPEQRKKIFKMSRKQGLSNEEIAQRLHINKRTVENHITNALAEIRKTVGRTLIFFI